MTFTEATSLLPTAVRVWVLWLTLVMFAVPLILLAFHEWRKTALVILGANILVAVLMTLAYEVWGMVRLLGIVHIIIWTPLCYYIWKRVRLDTINVPVALVVILLGSLLVSLGFDYLDVIRYTLGERQTLI